MTEKQCPCGQGEYAQCCQPLHAGKEKAQSAEQLMRSRYSAYVLGLVDYLVATTLPVQQPALDRDAMAAWSAQSTWLGLEVEGSEVFAGKPEHTQVSFVARWHDDNDEHRHRECSAFVQVDERWFFLDPTVPLKAGRNDPCPCQGGQKFKKCCG